MNESPVCHQVNLQQGFGGGEVYTCFFTRALQELGWGVRLYVSKSNTQWKSQVSSDVELVPLDTIDDLPKALPATPTTVIFHTPQPAPLLRSLKERYHRLCVFAHMPLYGRNPTMLMEFDYIIAVSQHVINSLQAVGLSRHHPVPLLGVADLERRNPHQEQIVRGPIFDWDRRKVRERIGRWLTPAVAPFLPRPKFVRRPGISLGIVSRLTPIKQFPLLFSHIAPLLAEETDINLEIFGSGGYASIRDLRLALRPIAKRYRFWGHQDNVRAVYSQLDGLLTGLPEKEALGLNILEAQACGLPVLAVDAPPFDETVANDITGWRYTDPRTDGGRDFTRALADLRKGLVAEREAIDRHLSIFGFPAFTERVQSLMEALPSPLRPPP